MYHLNCMYTLRRRPILRRRFVWIMVLALLMSLYSSSFVVAEEMEVYPDIVDHPAEEAIESLYEIGALNFSMDEPLHPDHAISKANYIYMLLTTKGITPQVREHQISFSDVKEGDWFYPYIETAYQLGIIVGNSTGEYRPMDPITKQEAIVMLLRATGEVEVARKYNAASEVLAQFKDGKNVADWAKRSVAYAINKTYYAGVQRKDGLYINPTANLTRAEAANLIYQSLYQRLLLDTIQKDDVDAIPITYFKKIEVTASAYNSGESDVGAYSYTELPVRYGLVAVDPTVIPLGTHLYIPGYGFAVAADIGGKIKGATIDLYMNTYAEAKAFGRKKDVQVYILDPIEVK